MDSTSELVRKTEELRIESEKLEEKLAGNRAAARDTSLAELARSQGTTSVHPVVKSQRILRGHLSKVYSVTWASDSRRIASVGQDSRIIVWNAFSGNKIHAITIKSPWVLTCSFSGGHSKYVAEGGLSNLVSIYDVSQNETQTEPRCQLRGHTGYVSSLAFIGESQLVSGSGDASLILWDVNSRKFVVTLLDHQADVTSVTVSPSDPRLVLSGACDATVKLWDTRTGKTESTFSLGSVDVNSVKFFPSGTAFAAGLDDGQTKLFDMRTDSVVAQYGTVGSHGVTSVDFSRSGRILAVVHDDPTLSLWDTLTGERVSALPGHSRPISNAAFAPDGCALATASWDSTIRIWG